VSCSELQCVAVCCSAVQCVAVRCIELQRVADLFHTHEKGMSHIRMNHVTHVNESCQTYE